MIKKIFILTVAVAMMVACKKKGCTDVNAINYNSGADKNDGSCLYDLGVHNEVPSTYTFKDTDGNSTVEYQSQADLFKQLEEMVVVMETGTEEAFSATILFKMFGNDGGNGGGKFSFTSAYGLEFQTSSDGESQLRSWMYDLATASSYHGYTAASGQAGVLTSGSKKYLFDQNGYERVRLIEKGIMGAVFMNRALNVYFGENKMNVDNATAVDPSNGAYYTAMEHHFDMAFGSFGVPTDFPTNIPDHLWGKYCNERDAELNSNTIMMDNFLKGRTAVSNGDTTKRDAAIQAIRVMWENIAAKQALYYLIEAKTNLNSDKAKALHALSEAYGFAWILRYAPSETGRMTNWEYGSLIGGFPANMWDINISNIDNLIAVIESKY